MQKKWELIFPLLRDYYNPWIQSARYLSGYLKEIKDMKSFSVDEAARTLFYLTLFFSLRLQFSIKAGGRPILAEDKDEEQVLNSYREVERSLSWKESQTRSQVSYLQNFYIQKNKPDSPYLSYQFIQDAKDPNRQPELANICGDLQSWLNKDHAENAAKALDDFQLKFKNGIGKLYSGWAS